MSVTDPEGFEAGGIACGIKEGGVADLAVVAATTTVPAAAIFTRNAAAAAPVIVSRRNVADGAARAVVLNSGCANAVTGAEGLAVAKAMAASAAELLGCRETDVIVCSTGPIGSLLQLDKVTAGLGDIEITPDGGAAAASAILTTDSRTKEAVVRSGGFVVGGMAKGAGMIRPDMATMLAVLTTDAVADADRLRSALRHAADRSFNALNVDGCESTNDTVVLMASGASGVDPAEGALEEAVEEVCRTLARQMAADAEGASRVVTIDLTGATDDVVALELARAIADSALVRASFYGADPNWGRVVAAMGTCRQPFDLGAVEVAYAGTTVAENGVGIPVDEDEVSEKLSGDFTIAVSVGSGPGACSLLTTDLTPDYVRFNGERS